MIHLPSGHHTLAVVSEHEPTVATPIASAARAEGSERLSSAILTVPNLITLSRLACLPVFVWLLLAEHNRIAAAFLLGGLGATDWIDGYVARRLDQRSEFGAKFDPTVDRILFIVCLLAIMADGSMPLWFAVAILAREVAVGGTIAIATLFLNMQRFDVTFWGKTATFLLMFAVPGFVLSESGISGADGFGYVAWMLGVPGLALSYLTGVGYLPKIRDGVRSAR
jgi:cardiolipin synthase (CMP-forming)